MVIALTIFIFFCVPYMHLFFTCLHFLWTLRIPVKTHALIFYVPYMFIFYVICTSPLSTSFHVAFFGFQTRKTSRFLAYVLLWEIMFDTWQLLKYTEHLTEMQGFCLKMVNFFSFFRESIRWFFNWSDEICLLGSGS